jgi:hypothetical protein
VNLEPGQVLGPAPFPAETVVGRQFSIVEKSHAKGRAR